MSQRQLRAVPDQSGADVYAKSSWSNANAKLNQLKEVTTVNSND
jgi:hypothetical protein